MKHAAPFLCAIALTAPAAAADSYTIDPRHTYPVFEINHLGFSTQRGRFTKSSGKIVLDPAAKSGRVEVSIDANSIDMGFEEWNKHMRGPDYFNTDKFPTITFTADKLAFAGDDPSTVQGSLTLLGETRPVSLQVTAFKCAIEPITRKAKCGADVVASLKRSEFGMKRLVPYIGDEVKIVFGIEAYKD